MGDAFPNTPIPSSAEQLMEIVQARCRHPWRVIDGRAIVPAGAQIGGRGRREMFGGMFVEHVVLEGTAYARVGVWSRGVSFQKAHGEIQISIDGVMHGPWPYVCADCSTVGDMLAAIAMSTSVLLQVSRQLAAGDYVMVDDVVVPLAPGGDA